MYSFDKINFTYFTFLLTNTILPTIRFILLLSELVSQEW